MYSVSSEAVSLNSYILRVHEGNHTEDAWKYLTPYVWSCTVVCLGGGRCEIKGVVAAPSRDVIRALAKFFVRKGHPIITWERASGKKITFDVRRWAK